MDEVPKAIGNWRPEPWTKLAVGSFKLLTGTVVARRLLVALRDGRAI